MLPINILCSTSKTSTLWDEILKEQAEINLIRGLRYFSQEDYSKASIEFLKAIEKNPSVTAYSLYGASLYWLGDIDGSIENYEKAIQIDSNNELPWHLKGISLAKKGEITKALDCFKKAEKINPQRSDLLMNIGSIYFSMERIEDAILYLKKAIENDESNPLYYFQLGLIYFYSEDFKKAEEKFQKAISLKNDYEEAILWLAISLEKQNDIKNAIKYYKKAISIKEKDFFARYMLSRIDKKENLRKNLSECFELVPDNNTKTIALSIAYTKNSNTSPSNSIKDTLLNIGKNETAVITVDIIEIENFTMNVEGELAKKLSQKYKPLTYKTITKTYKLDGNSQNKEKEIDKILNDIENLTKNKNYRMNISTKIEKKSIEKEDNDLKYIPRNIGNDMGLWVIGNPWIEIIQENLEAEKNLSPEINAVGNLLIGNIEEAENLFLKANDIVISNLGLGVISYLKGAKNDSIKYFKEVLKIDPKNQTALKNIRWIDGNK